MSKEDQFTFDCGYVAGTLAGAGLAMAGAAVVGPVGALAALAAVAYGLVVSYRSYRQLRPR